MSEQLNNAIHNSFRTGGTAGDENIDRYNFIHCTTDVVTTLEDAA